MENGNSRRYGNTSSRTRCTLCLSRSPHSTETQTLSQAEAGGSATTLTPHPQASYEYEVMITLLTAMRPTRTPGTSLRQTQSTTYTRNTTTQPRPSSPPPSGA